MDVYIRGMEMPTNTDMAPTAVWIYPNGYAVVFKDNGKMKQYTQAVHVPPHGRLIDADELRLVLWKRAKEFSNSEYGEGVKCGLADAREYIKIAPTIIPAEEGE